MISIWVYGLIHKGLKERGIYRVVVASHHFYVEVFFFCKKNPFSYAVTTWDLSLCFILRQSVMPLWLLIGSYGALVEIVYSRSVNIVVGTFTLFSSHITYWIQSRFTAGRRNCCIFTICLWVSFSVGFVFQRRITWLCWCDGNALPICSFGCHVCVVSHLIIVLFHYTEHDPNGF